MLGQFLAFGIQPDVFSLLKRAEVQQVLAEEMRKKEKRVSLGREREVRLASSREGKNIGLSIKVYT